MPISRVRLVFYCKGLEIGGLVNQHRASLDLIGHQFWFFPRGTCGARKRLACSASWAASRTDSVNRGFAISFAMSARVARVYPSFLAIFCVMPTSCHASRGLNGQ